MKPYDVKVITDGGPWAEHDMPCPIYCGESAVLCLAQGRFSPSWQAQKQGWQTIRAPKWVWFILNFLPIEKS